MKPQPAKLHRLFKIAFIVILFTASCAPVKPEHTAEPAATPQPTRVVDSSTPALTAEPMATVTPQPARVVDSSTPDAQAPMSLPHQGPYLVVDREDPIATFVLYGANGSGRRYIKLPNIANNNQFGTHNDLTSFISPNGEWIAYIQGDINSPGSLTLCLYNMDDETIKPLTKVVSSDSVDRLIEQAGHARELFPGRYNPEADPVSIIIDDFQYNLIHLAWSPDSRYLAFAALLDGVSLDLYIYDLKTEEIKRLTSDVENISSIEWSPDGKFILYENSEPGEIYILSSLYTARPEDTLPMKFESLKESRALQSGFLGKEGWIGSDKILTFDTGGDTALKTRLEYHNLATGGTNMLWEDIYDDFAVDLSHPLIVLSARLSIMVDINQTTKRLMDGLFLISLDGTYQHISDEWLQELTFRDGEFSRFVGKNEMGNVIAISNTGALKTIGNRPDSVFRVSPDHTWLAVQNYNGIDFYDREDQLVKTINIEDLSGMIWGQDSKSIFYVVNDKALYYLPLPEGVPTLVDDCSSEGCSFSLEKSVWLP